MDRRKETLGFLLADIARLVRAAFRQRLEASSITHAQARALIYLSRQQGMCQVELAELLDIQPMTLTRLIDRLEEDRLVERRRDPADRRAYRLFLTRAAAVRLEAVEAVVDSIRSEALRGITAKEASVLLATLLKIRENLARR